MMRGRASAAGCDRESRSPRSSPLRLDGLLHRRLTSVSTTIRVSEETRQRVAALAKATGRQMQQVLEEAVDAYERELFFTQLTDGFAALDRDAQAAAEVDIERAGESPALRDGLRDDEPPATA